MVLPSGENATLVTASVCPFRSVRKKPKVASCTRTVLSSAAMAIVLPSGEYATPRTGAAAGGADSFCSSVASRLLRASGCVPQLDLLVEAGSGHALAIGRGGDCGDRLLMFEREEDFAGRKVPNVGGVVSAA